MHNPLFLVPTYFEGIETGTLSLSQIGQWSLKIGWTLGLFLLTMALIAAVLLLWKSLSLILALPSRASMAEATEKLQAALNEREAAGDERFRLALEASPNAILVADTDGKITFVNAQTEALFGYTRQELLQAPLEMLVPHTARKLHMGHVKNFSEDPQIRAMGAGREVRGLRKDGREFPAEIALGPFRHEGRLRVIAFIADITARKIADERILEQSHKLERSNQDLELFAYAASHDLQEPLRGMMGYLQLLHRQHKDQMPEKALHFLNQAIDSGHRMKVLMEALLQYSRAGRQVEAKTIDLIRLVNEVQLDLHVPIEESGITIQIDNLPTVESDSLALRQIYQNLVSNAIKFRVRENPMIHLGFKMEKGETILFVRDNGIGIPLEYQGRLFILFQRLHERANYPGSGVGLALVAKAVRGLGGKIWVESREGGGSTFYFTLPT